MSPILLKEDERMTRKERMIEREPCRTSGSRCLRKMSELWFGTFHGASVLAANQKSRSRLLLLSVMSFVSVGTCFFL